MSHYELLPCPFCGEDVEIDKDEYAMRPEYIPGYKIRCYSCKFEMSEHQFYQTLEQAKEKLVLKWNRRVLMLQVRSHE